MVVFILKKYDNNIDKNYFIYKRHIKCKIHNSDTCECTLNVTKEELKRNIRNSLDFYKICTSFFMVDNKKLYYINIKNKVDIIYCYNYNYNNYNNYNNKL